MKFLKKKYWKLRELKISVFLSWPFWIFLLHPHENQSQIVWYNGWDLILMFSLVSSKFLAMRNITLYSVCFCFFHKIFLYYNKIASKLRNALIVSSNIHAWRQGQVIQTYYLHVVVSIYFTSNKLSGSWKIRYLAKNQQT